MTFCRLHKPLSVALLAVRSPASVVRARRAIRRFGAIQRTYELAAALRIIDRLKPRVVIEIGSHRGGTLHAWSTVAAADALIVAVDVPLDESTALGTPERLVRSGQRIEHVSGDSHAASTAAEVTRRLAGAPADFLFVDGDHTLRGVVTDLGMYARLVRDGGIIALHDVIRNPAAPENEVWKLWQRMRALDGAIEITDADAHRDGGMGIGMITMTPQLRNEPAWQTH